jgi:hypothetical protein
MNTGLQNQDVCYEWDSSSKATAQQKKIIIDPNIFSIEVEVK